MRWEEQWVRESERDNHLKQGLYFTVSNPISKKNHTRFDSRSKHTYKSRELVEFEKQVYDAIQCAMAEQKWVQCEESISVYAIYDSQLDVLHVSILRGRYKANRRRKDLQNMMEVVFDVLEAPSMRSKRKAYKAGAILNDKQVSRFCIWENHEGK